MKCVPLLDLFKLITFYLQVGFKTMRLPFSLAVGAIHMVQEFTKNMELFRYFTHLAKACFIKGNMSLEKVDNYRSSHFWKSLRIDILNIIIKEDKASILY